MPLIVVTKNIPVGSEKRNHIHVDGSSKNPQVRKEEYLRTFPSLDFEFLEVSEVKDWNEVFSLVERDLGSEVLANLAPGQRPQGSIE